MLYLIYWEAKGGEVDVLDTVEFTFDFHYRWLVANGINISCNYQNGYWIDDIGNQTIRFQIMGIKGDFVNDYKH